MMQPEWIEHDGSAVCPVPEGHDVELKYRNGEILRTTEAHVYRMDWDHDCLDMPQHDITHYRDWTVWEQRQESKMAEPKLLTEQEARVLLNGLNDYEKSMQFLRERGLIAQEPEPETFLNRLEAAIAEIMASGNDITTYEIAVGLQERGLTAERKPLTRGMVRQGAIRAGCYHLLVETDLDEERITRLHAALKEAMQ